MNEQVERIEDLLDRHIRSWQEKRKQGDLLAEFRLIQAIGRRYAELVQAGASKKSESLHLRVAKAKTMECLRAQFELAGDLGAQFVEESKVDAGRLALSLGFCWQSWSISQGDAKVLAGLILAMQLIVRNPSLAKDYLAGTSGVLAYQCEFYKELYCGVPMADIPVGSSNDENWQDACRVELLSFFQAWRAHSRMASTATWSQVLPSLDKALARSKKVFDDCAAGRGKSADLTPSSEIVLLSYALLAQVNLLIGDSDLAERTLWVAADFCQRNIANRHLIAHFSHKRQFLKAGNVTSLLPVNIDVFFFPKESGRAWESADAFAASLPFSKDLDDIINSAHSSSAFYFAERKASQNLQRLVDRHMQLVSRKRQSGGLRLTCRRAMPKMAKSGRKEVATSERIDLFDFIDDDDEVEKVPSKLSAPSESDAVLRIFVHVDDASHIVPIEANQSIADLYAKTRERVAVVGETCELVIGEDSARLDFGDRVGSVLRDGQHVRFVDTRAPDSPLAAYRRLGGNSSMVIDRLAKADSVIDLSCLNLKTVDIELALSAIGLVRMERLTLLLSDNLLDDTLWVHLSKALKSKNSSFVDLCGNCIQCKGAVDAGGLLPLLSLHSVFVDLRFNPISNTLPSSIDMSSADVSFPIRILN